MSSVTQGVKTVQFCSSCGLDTVFEIAIENGVQIDRCLSCGAVSRIDYARLRAFLKSMVEEEGSGAQGTERRGYQGSSRLRA